MLTPTCIPRQPRAHTVKIAHSDNFDSYELLDSAGCTFAEINSATFDPERQVTREQALAAFALLIPKTDTLRIREVI